MTRVLVVNHDVDLADLEVEGLRRAGYVVDQCGGPTHARTTCPVTNGATCWQVDWADVLVYDAFAAGDGGRELIEHIRLVYPDKPVVLTAPGVGLTWTDETSLDRVRTVFGAPTTPALSRAIDEALASDRIEALTG